jgi:hypothetical protein
VNEDRDTAERYHENQPHELPVPPSRKVRGRRPWRSRRAARNPRSIHYQVLMTISQRMFQRVHFPSWSCRDDASRRRRIRRSSQEPRRNAFAGRAMNSMRKFMPPAQRRRRRAFDSASKERRVNAGATRPWFSTR